MKPELLQTKAGCGIQKPDFTGSLQNDSAWHKQRKYVPVFT
jgi:hypothetical protein